jgi:HK97 gp10 family phage protein
MPAAHLTLTGDKELLRTLNRLEAKATRRVVRPAASKAMTPVLKDARRRARDIGEHGALAKSLGKKTKTYSRAGVVMVIIGPRSDYQDPATGHKPSKTAHLVEYGTAPHTIQPKHGKVLVFEPDTWNTPTVIARRTVHPGAKPQPFMRPAFDTKSDQASYIFMTEVRKNILKEAKRR